MSRVISIGCFCGLILLGCDAGLDSVPLLEESQSQEAAFAVVELFTSQGCSSCPPADLALANLVEWSRAEELPVYCLSFHVDYWNDLGWKDPYSDKRYTRRQRDYVRALRNRRPYTPQMVVNGQYEFVGAREEHAKEVIAAALHEPPQTAIDIEAALTSSGKELAVVYEVRGRTENSVLNVVVVKSKMENQVGSGENSGRMLKHAQVVRAYRSVPIAGGGTKRITLPVPYGVKSESSEVIVYTQDRTTRHVTGVTKAQL